MNRYTWKKYYWKIGIKIWKFFEESIYIAHYLSITYKFIWRIEHRVDWK